MGARRLARSWGVFATIIVGFAPASARAGDHVEVIVTESTEGDGNDTADPPGTASPPGSSVTTHTVHVVQRPARTSGAMSWFGISVGVPVTPMSNAQTLDPDHVTANRMRACSSRGDKHFCTAMRGVDVRLQFFTTQSEKSYPRVITYLRSGYDTGDAAIASRDPGGHVHGEATSIAYSAVPLFVGANIYVVKDFPLRPFAGAGFGVSIMKLHYRRHEDAPLDDLSARVGVEVHGGLEARITNYLAFTVEVRQQWSMRRHPPGVPAFANDTLAVIGGLAWGIPGWEASRRSGQPARVTTVTHVTKTLQPPGPPRRKSIFNRRSVPLPEPPTAAPPPVHIDPTAPSSTPARAPG